MLIAFIPVLVLIIGLLVYALASNGKVQEIGRISFFVGLFFTVAEFARHTIRIG